MFGYHDLDPDDRFFGVRKYVPHALSYEGRDVFEDQPWLSYLDNELCESLGAIHESRLMHWILTPKFEIVEEPNSMRWSMFMERAEHRHVGNTRLPNFKWLDNSPSIHVSTIFCGVAPNELFETMIFGGPLDHQRWKTDTYGGAKCQHQAAIDLVRQCCNYLRRRKRGRMLAKAFKRSAKIVDSIRTRNRRHYNYYRMLYNAHVMASKVPGGLTMPHPNCLMEMAMLFISKPSKFNRHDVRGTTETDSTDS